MTAAARFTDYCAGHCFEARPNDQGSPNFFINGLATHRVTDHWPTHSCPPASHDSVTVEGSPNFFVNGLAQARIGDKLSCDDIIAQGSPNFFVN